MKEYFFDVDVVIVCVMDFIMTARIKSNPPNSVTSGAWGKSVRPPAALLVHVCVYSSLMHHTHTLVA